MRNKFITGYLIVIGGLILAFILSAPVANADEFKDNLYSVIVVEHISSLPDGRPFNSKPETAADMLQMGIRYKKNTWKVDVLIGTEVNSSFRGDNPRFILRIEKEHKLFNRGT